jgi:hypothetical protein
MMRKPHRAAAVAVLVAAGVTIPCAAHAAFTARAAASMPASTATLALPQGSFTADCDRDRTGPYHSLTLTPDSMGVVKGATGYEVVLTGPSGERFAESFATGAALVVSVKKKGDWAYAVRAIHTATSSNVWTGPLSAEQTVACDKD